MEDGILGCLGEGGEGRVVADNGEKLIVIDVEGLLQESLAGVVLGSPWGLMYVSSALDACRKRESLRCWHCSRQLEAPWATR